MLIIYIPRITIGRRILYLRPGFFIDGLRPDQKWSETDHSLKYTIACVPAVYFFYNLIASQKPIVSRELL